MGQWPKINNALLLGAAQTGNHLSQSGVTDVDEGLLTEGEEIWDVVQLVERWEAAAGLFLICLFPVVIATGKYRNIVYSFLYFYFFLAFIS